jgi:D-glycero-D-manno-heptose 1,7-bisphosphate phosphatase
MVTEKNTKLVILDRDGVINLQSKAYIKSVDEWVAIESSLTAIARLNKAGYKVAIATNQSGLARGYFSEDELHRMHQKMDQLLAKVGGHIDAVEFCPDHPDNPGPNRKPNPGMLNKHLERFNATPKQTWFVGDSRSDIDCAINADCIPALVLTGDGKETQAEDGLPNDLAIFDNLAEFVEKLLAT